MRYFEVVNYLTLKIIQLVGKHGPGLTATVMSAVELNKAAFWQIFSMVQFSGGLCYRNILILVIWSRENGSRFANACRQSNFSCKLRHSLNRAILLQVQTLKFKGVLSNYLNWIEFVKIRGWKIWHSKTSIKTDSCEFDWMFWGRSSIIGPCLHFARLEDAASWGKRPHVQWQHSMAARMEHGSQHKT